MQELQVMFGMADFNFRQLGRRKWSYHILSHEVARFHVMTGLNFVGLIGCRLQKT